MRAPAGQPVRSAVLSFAAYPINYEHVAADGRGGEERGGEERGDGDEGDRCRHDDFFASHLCICEPSHRTKLTVMRLYKCG